MAEIDMIPRSFHLARRRGLVLRQLAIAAVSVLGAGLLAYLLLAWRIAVEQPSVTRLRVSTGQSAALHAELEALGVRRNALEARLAVFSALRGAGDVTHVMTALDRALPQGVWFTQMQFYRDKQLASPAPTTSGAVAPLGGVSLAVPVDATGKASATETTTWRIGKNLDISGDALDHAALATFLQQLGAQPGVAEVRFLKSAPQASDGVQRVAFNLTMRSGKPLPEAK
jgi:Tfp pilus assembly protein PilN